MKWPLLEDLRFSVVPPLKKFMLVVKASPGTKVIYESPKPILGYLQILGVTCENQQDLITLVREHLQNDLGSDLLDVQEIWIPDFEGKDADYATDPTKMEQRGVWWEGARFFYSADDDDEGNDE